MIPTMLLVGLLLGKWWRVVIPVASIGWALLLVRDGVDSGAAFFAEAALVGFVNVTLGVLVFQVVRLLLRPVPSSGNHARG